MENPIGRFDGVRPATDAESVRLPTTGFCHDMDPASDRPVLPGTHGCLACEGEIGTPDAAGGGVLSQRDPDARLRDPSTAGARLPAPHQVSDEDRRLCNQSVLQCRCCRRIDAGEHPVEIRCLRSYWQIG